MTRAQAAVSHGEAVGRGCVTHGICVGPPGHHRVRLAPPPRAQRKRRRDEDEDPKHVRPLFVEERPHQPLEDPAPLAPLWMAPRHLTLIDISAPVGHRRRLEHRPFSSRVENQLLGAVGARRIEADREPTIGALPAIDRRASCILEDPRRRPCMQLHRGRRGVLRPVEAVRRRRNLRKARP